MRCIWMFWFLMVVCLTFNVCFLMCVSDVFGWCDVCMTCLCGVIYVCVMCVCAMCVWLVCDVCVTCMCLFV